VDPRVAVAEVVISFAFLDKVSIKDVLSLNKFPGAQEPPDETASLSMGDIRGGLA
jgi:hypothetical protein